MSTSLTQIALEVQTKEDFIRFLELLVHDLRHDPVSWENDKLDTYLDAMAAWTGDMDGFYANLGVAQPKNVNWQVFAHILMAATIYE